MDLNIYKVDLDTDQPNGGKGESPRSAFTKYNNSLDTINGELTTLGESVDTINGELTTLGESVDTINGELTTLDDSAMKKAANLSDLADAATARSNLGLGSAATKAVGTSSGQLMEVGAFGIGVLDSPHITNMFAQTTRFGGSSFIPAGTNSLPISNQHFGMLSFGHSGPYGYSILVSYRHAFLRYRETNDSWAEYVEFYTKANTTVDSNGFVKAASPIIKLFNARIERTECLEIANIEFERVDVGHYVLHNTPLLSRDGWYIETPKDRNNNIYFYLDYDENETDKTLTIKTYEPDYSTGRVTAGAPVDILEGRFVSLRFEELTEE